MARFFVVMLSVAAFAAHVHGYSCAAAKNRQDCECWFCLNSAVDMFADKSWSHRADCLSSFLGALAPVFVDVEAKFGGGCDQQTSEFAQCMCPLMEAHFSDVADYCSDICTGELKPRDKDEIEKTISSVMSVFNLLGDCPGSRVSCMSGGSSKLMVEFMGSHESHVANASLGVKVAISDSSEAGQHTYSLLASLDATAQTSHAQMNSAACLVGAGILSTLL